jgi:hypothetical protein
VWNGVLEQQPGGEDLIEWADQLRGVAHATFRAVSLAKKKPTIRAAVVLRVNTLPSKDQGPGLPICC